MRLNELEIKVKINSPEQFDLLLKTCKDLYGTPSYLLQLDEYFDNLESQLKKQDLVIRIRTIGTQKIIALKSPRVMLESGMSHRIELEFEALAGEKVQEQLANQGLKSLEAYEKERWTFVANDCEIVLDKLPFIGTFIEIEGPSEAAIQDLVKKLKLSENSIISKNYGELMKDKFLELSLPLSNIQATFAKESEILKRV
jgi:predicted adenylyl cyclase CyaB